jgi:hypothetical protein
MQVVALSAKAKKFVTQKNTQQRKTFFSKVAIENVTIKK